MFPFLHFLRLALSLFLDEELGSDLYLDGVITVVDAKYSLEQLQESAGDRYWYFFSICSIFWPTFMCHLYFIQHGVICRPSDLLL
jgi:G3E family GTPase